MQRAMRGLLHLGERKQTNVVRLADLFKSPANAHVACESGAAIGGLFKGGNGGGLLHRHQRLAVRAPKIGHVGDQVQWPFHRAIVGKQVSTMSRPLPERDRFGWTRRASMSLRVPTGRSADPRA